DRLKSVFQLPYTIGNLCLRLDHNLSGCARCRRSKIGDKVADGEVHFVTNCGDHRLFRPDDGTRDAFFIEWPQVFHRPATTRDDDDIDIRRPAEVIDAFHHLNRCAVTLNLGWKDQDIDRIVPTFQYREN